MKKNNIIIVFVFIIIILSVFIILNILSKDNKKDVKENKKEENKMTTTIKKDDNIMEGISHNYHASIRIEKNGKIIYFDPYKIKDNVFDADYIFITHSHYDHYDEESIKKVFNNNTKFIVTSDLESKVKNIGVSINNITVVYPNESYKVDNILFETVPAYNITKSYHKKSYNWVGYVVTLNNIKYYIVGDSDSTDEVKNVICDVIFVPVGGTYTMDYEEASKLVNTMNVKYAIPIHYSEVGTSIDAQNFINNLNENIKGVILNK